MIITKDAGPKIREALRHAELLQSYLHSLGLAICTPVDLLDKESMPVAQLSKAGMDFDEDAEWSLNTDYTPPFDPEPIDEIRRLLAPHITAEMDDALSTMSLDGLAGVIHEGLLAVEQTERVEAGDA